MIKTYKLFYFIQSLLKYIPFRFAIKLRRFLYKFFFKDFGGNIIIHDNVLIKFPSDISIGDNFQIAQNTVIVGGGGLKIGKNVMVGDGTKIITSSHNFNKKEIPMKEQGLSFNPIEINDDVWLGFNVIVLGGVKIGKGVIVGANSVVNKDIPDYSIVAGIPAKVIKNRK